MNLKIRAIEVGLTGAEIARAFGVTDASVSKWLNRKASVPDYLKVRLATMLQVRVEDLLPPEDAQ